MGNKSRILSLLLIPLLVLLHLPFLHADPDYFLSTGRDAFTDEGLNTSQVRNFINHGYLNLNECDNMIKSPLFNLLLFFPLKFFGTYLIVARLTVLSFLITVLVCLAGHPYFARLILLLFITTLTQFYVFQYSHFSLSEMLAVCCILTGIYFLFRRFTGFHTQLGKKTVSDILLSALFLSLAYYFKIQFAYIILLLPFSLLILENKSSEPLLKAPVIRLLLKSAGFLLLFAITYFLAWYLPFRSTFDFMMNDQTAGKFSSLSAIPKTIGFNIVYVLFGDQAWWFNTGVLACLISGILLYKSSSDKVFKVMFALSSIWVLMELHKLSMIYLPSRYLVSYYFAAGLMCSTVLLKLISYKEPGKVLASYFFVAGLSLTAFFFIANTIHFTLLLERRTFSIEAINDYFSSALKNPEQPVMGPWAPAVTWNSKARCIPVWKDFMNDKNIVQILHPQAILSEPDEAESNKAYSSQGMKPELLSDSSRTFQIGRWSVIVYWMN
ncbi:MAG: hypothetical protein ABIQ74_14470 [Chitinophagales bacterium]